MAVEQRGTGAQREPYRRSSEERRTGVGRRIRNRRLDDAPVENEQRKADRRSSSGRRGGNVSYSLSESVLEVTVEGHFTAEAELAVIGEGLASIPSGAKPGVLVDITRSREYKRLPDFERLAMLLGEYAGSLDGRVGIVVSDPVRFGSARQFSSLVERYGLEARPFKDRGAAVDWLHTDG